MPTVESLKLLPVWLNPGHLIASARVLMTGHRIKALGVLDGDQLVGMVTSEGVAALPDEASVRDAMEHPSAVVEGADSVRQAAEAFIDQELERAPVVKSGRFLGVLTAGMLLKELRRSWDPLTGLSWSDALREWGMESLQEGNEIVVLFVDLNDFGAYNKQFGHVVGDKVLQMVASFLREQVPEEEGVLVRYGGDEFAIGLVGTHDVGVVMADKLRAASGTLSVVEADAPISFCVGLSGGKRSKEREHVHYAATLDNLINLASTDCLAQKGRAPRQSKPSGVTRPEVQVLSVLFDENNPSSLTQVVLSFGENVMSGVHARTGKSLIESVAIATLKALERAYPDVVLEFGEVNLRETPAGDRLVTVTGRITDGKGTVEFDNSQPASGDLYENVAQAAIAGVTQRL